MMVAAYAGICVLIAWAMLGGFFALLLWLFRPKALAILIFAAVFGGLAVVPPLVARAWFDAFWDEAERYEREHPAPIPSEGSYSSSISRRARAAISSIRSS